MTPPEPSSLPVQPNGEIRRFPSSALSVATPKTLRYDTKVVISNKKEGRPNFGRPWMGYDGYFSFFAFSRAASSPPTYMNACSGMSSAWPLTMASKLLIVSSRDVYTPGKPVNCSATKNG